MASPSAADQTCPAAIVAAALLNKGCGSEAKTTRSSAVNAAIFERRAGSHADGGEIAVTNGKLVETETLRGFCNGEQDLGQKLVVLPFGLEHAVEKLPCRNLATTPAAEKNK